MRGQAAREPLSSRIGAGLATAAILCLFARVLWQLPEADPEAREPRLQIRWVPRVTDGPVLPGVPITKQKAEIASRAPASVSPGPATEVAVPPIPAPSVPAGDAPSSLYDSNGKVVLPGDVISTSHVPGADARVFEHRDELATGIGERATAGLFSHGPAGTKQKRTERWLYGEDIQPAEARRPPDVAFNPALHERPSDLGSEATGDAYKAAPIRHEPVPGLDGEASRRIRVAIDELEQRYPRCSADARRQWLAPVLQHLDALQRLEYRYRHGADPIEIAHTLPSSADSAYDLAQRGLWVVERSMKSCG